MLYAATLHLLAGAVTGLAFKVRTLSVLLTFVLFESLILSLAHGTNAGLWALANLVGLQVGYFAGMFGRGALERTGNSLTGARTRRLP